MKTHLINWICTWQTADFSAGLQLYRDVRQNYLGQADPIEATESDENRRVLAIKLGNLLRSIDFDKEPQTLKVPAKAQVATNPKPQTRNPQSNEGDDSVDLPLQSKISLDIDSLIQLRRAGHNALHTLATDAERKLKLRELEEIQERISYCRQILRQLQKGEKASYDPYIPAAEENDFEVPATPLELQKKYQLMLQKRSKRKARLGKVPESDQEYQQVLSEWKHFDNVVRHLKAKLDEFKKPAA